MKNLRLRVLERFNFFLERQFVKGTHIQLLFVASLIGLMSVLGGVLVLPSGEPTDSITDSLWWAFLRLSDPGYLGDDQGTWRRMVSTLLTIAGNVLFVGSLVAIITTWLNRKIRNLEQGLTKVSANNHIVILGWTNRTVHIAAELFQSTKRVKKFLKRAGARVFNLIILSDDVTPDRLQELKDNPLIGKRAKEIVLRSGEAIDREHLQRVDCMNASAIIIPSLYRQNRELITPDVETIKTLLSLNSEALKRKKMPYVVAEIQDENKLIAARRAYSGPMEVIPGDTFLSRLIAQNLHHNGLSFVFNELLSHSLNNNIYVLDLPPGDDNTIHSLKACFPRAIIFGVVREQESGLIPILNTTPDFKIQENDKLVLLARKIEDIEITPESIRQSSGNSIGFKQHERPVSKKTTGKFKILILGWNHQIPALLKELGTYSNEEFHLTMASLRAMEAREIAINHVLQSAKNISIDHKYIDYIRESELRSLDPSTYDHILLVSSDKIADEEEADARTIVGYTLLEEVLESGGKRPQILMELIDPSNELLIKNFDSESIIGSLILSNLLATIAMRRELYTVYNELFTVNGAEIIFREISDYNLEPGLVTFSQLEEHIASYQDTALGIFAESADGTVDLKLNPDRDHHLHLTDDKRLVVLSTVDMTKIA